MALYAPGYEQTHSTYAYRGEAQGLFEQALWRGMMYRTFARLRGQPVHLRVCARPAMRYEKSQMIPLDRIQGSLGRVSDFDAHFYPIHERSAERWINIALLVLAGAPLPPVSLVENDGVYYVIDGHHRISVARMMGATEIEALVA